MKKLVSKNVLCTLCAVSVLCVFCMADAASLTQSAKKTDRASFTFTDDLQRSVTVTSCSRVAVLQGSLAAIWQLAGGTVAAATKDAFVEPPALSAEEALSLNEKWHTQAFRAHGAGVFAVSASRAAAQGNASGSGAAAVFEVGTMMAPNSELLLSQAPDFVILSANISGHKKLLPLLEKAGIPCACFKYETFSNYLHILDIFTQLTDRRDLYAEYGERVENACRTQIETALAKRISEHSVLLLRAFGTGVLAKDSCSLAVGDLLSALGTRNIADTGTLSTGDLSLEAIIAEDPDFIFVTTMGTNEEKALAAFDAKLASNPAWSGLSAVKANRCVVLPRELFHFKPLGMDWLSCYQILTDILYGN